MKTPGVTSKRSNITAAIAILLLIGSALYLTFEMRANEGLKEELKNEKLSSEELLSEKLSLEKEIVKLKMDIKTLEDNGKNLDKELESVTNKLVDAEQKLKDTQKQANSAAQLRKQNQELQRIKGELEEQLAGLRYSLTEINNANEDMERLIAQLRDENQNLKDNLKTFREASINDVLTESMKKNGKLTVTGKRTKKFVISIDVPSDAENLKLRIISPDRKELPVAGEDVTVRVISQKTQNSQAFYVAPDVNGPTYKRVEMAYVPKEKLVTGTYKVMVLSNDMSIGSLQVKFR